MKSLFIAAVTALLTNDVIAADSQTVTLDVKNMYCDLCPITVRKSLERVPSVAGAQVDFVSKTAVVRFDPTKASTAMLMKATTDAGFPSAARP